uniref:Uncharacterized protein n=1 Tax=Euplotes harpa TaxID=151035 RepID=A0A7S3J4J8_9SPIT|mmetsp:Transcript_19411/g.22617  ORF Transcript_19411/g.22617 Transcript_19411/m.22617 type:complete len:341 (+) Transcript_19411:222-1244(+)
MIVERCKILEGDALQVKLDYFFKPFGIDAESKPLLPMNFDSETPDSENQQELEAFFQKKAKENWGKLSKAIVNKNSEQLRNLIKSVNSYMYPQLKEFVKKIMSPEFQTVMNYLKNFPDEQDLEEKLMYAKSGIEELNRIMGVEQYSFYDPYKDSDKEDNKSTEVSNDDSLISSLLLLKRSKLEDIVERITKHQMKQKKPSASKLSKQIMTELSKKNIPLPRLISYTRKVKSKVSTNSMPVYSPLSRFSDFEESGFSACKKTGSKLKHNSNKKAKANTNYDSLASIIEDDMSEIENSIRIPKEEILNNDDSPSVSSFDSNDKQSHRSDLLKNLTKQSIAIS